MCKAATRTCTVQNFWLFWTSPGELLSPRLRTKLLPPLLHSDEKNRQRRRRRRHRGNVRAPQMQSDDVTIERPVQLLNNVGPVCSLPDTSVGRLEVRYRRRIDPTEREQRRSPSVRCVQPAETVDGSLERLQLWPRKDARSVGRLAAKRTRKYRRAHTKQL